MNGQFKARVYTQSNSASNNEIFGIDNIALNKVVTQTPVTPLPSNSDCQHVDSKMTSVTDYILCGRIHVWITETSLFLRMFICDCVCMCVHVWARVFVCGEWVGRVRVCV